jgi:hypothetical protein
MCAHLVLDKSLLLGHGIPDEPRLKIEVLKRVHCKIALLDIGALAVLLGAEDLRERLCGDAGHALVEARHRRELVLSVARGQRVCGEVERHALQRLLAPVREVCEPPAERLLDPPDVGVDPARARRFAREEVLPACVEVLQKGAPRHTALALVCLLAFRL